MHVLVTGADDIWGYLTAERVLQTPTLKNSSGIASPVESLVLVVHNKPYEPTIEEDPRVKVVRGDIADKAGIEKIILENNIDSVFHFETVTRDRDDGEDDFDGMINVNIFGSMNILEALRKAENKAKLVFCSSCSVFQDGITEAVSPATRRLPSSTYGATKTVVEILIANYTDRGFVDGRSSVLPMCVSWRPTAANTDFMHDVFKAPFDGKDIEIALKPDTRLFFNGFYSDIDNLIETHDIDSAALGEDRSLIQPGITVSIQEMVEAFQRIASVRGITLGEVVEKLDPEKQAGFDVYNKLTDFDRALGFGLSHEDLDTIVTRYLDAYLALS